MDTNYFVRVTLKTFWGNSFFLKKMEVCYFKQGKGTGEGRYQNRSLIVLPVLPFYSSCVQSTLIFSLNFHLIGEWHDKRELVQLNGLIETESSEKNPSTLHKKRQFTMWELQFMKPSSPAT